MRIDSERGSLAEPLLILVALLIMVFLYVVPKNGGGPTERVAPVTHTSSGGAVPGKSLASENNITSSYANKIRIGSGNAKYIIQPNQEYITLSNYGSQSIDITGWKLKNGKEDRIYELGGNLRRLTSDILPIPTATLSPRANPVFQNVLLKPGEKAIVTSGIPVQAFSFKITSFKENICTGYLETESPRTFNPALSRSCVDPSNEPGVQNLDTACRKFIDRMSSCDIPEFDQKVKGRDVCIDCADGVPLSSSCRVFLAAHYNYQGCMAVHSADTNFSLRTWRVFLGSSWEMWNKEDESISLFDQFNRLVDYVSY